MFIRLAGEPASSFGLPVQAETCRKVLDAAVVHLQPTTMTDDNRGKDVYDLSTLAGISDLWAVTTGEPEISIAILDTAVDTSHPCLEHSNLVVADVLSRGQETDIHATRHGTHIASVIFAQHDTPVKGIAPRCKGIIIPVYQVEDSILSCTQDDIAFAINEAVRLGAQVICISGGEQTPSGEASPTLAEAVRQSAQQRRLVVGAAGNDGCMNCLHVPGALPSVLAVGAMDHQGQPLEQSNWGGIYSRQGILAPGERIAGAWPGGGYSEASGTSFATPIVAGVAALLACVQLKRDGTSDLLSVRDAILNSASGCQRQIGRNCERFLAGRINILGALSIVNRTTGSHKMDDRPNDLPETTLQPAPTGVSPSNPQSFCDSTAPCPSSVTPSDCGCGGRAKGECGCGGGKSRQLVFAIGDKLWYDFGTVVRQSSIEDNYNGRIHGPVDLLRYLLGYRRAEGEHQVGGNLFDADSVYWILYQGDCPKYAIRPEGPFAEAVYKALLVFFIENNDLSQGDFFDHCLREYFTCHGGLSDPFRQFTHDEDGSHAPSAEATSVDPSGPATKSRKSHQPARQPPVEQRPPLESARTFDLGAETALFFGESPSQASHIAVPGRITGKLRLMNGEPVEVIAPQLRGMSNWNTIALVRTVQDALPNRDAATFITRIASRLYEESRNDGQAPEDRAKNWATTQFIRSFAPMVQSQLFRDFLGLERGSGPFVTAAVDRVTVKPAVCHRTGMEYDVEISLYDTENMLRGLTVVTSMIDVSDDVPVTISKYRITSRRS